MAIQKPAQKESLLDAITDLARDKGLPREKVVAVVQDAVAAAAKKKYKNYEDIEARFNTKSGAIEVFRYKTVIDSDDIDPDNEITLTEARLLDSLAESGDEVEYEIENTDLRRVISQTARQLVFQKLREAERENVFENFKDRKGEVLSGMVVRSERNRTILSFNNCEAILYGRETIMGERFSPGEHVRVVLLDVLNEPRERSQLVVSRTHPLLLIKLFEMEVPEVYDGIVEILGAAREPGRRAKVAVRSHDPDVDPVGACVGMRGSRVQAIIADLKGEKIDIIKWSEDLSTYVAAALAPAEISRMKIDEERLQIDVEVEPDQLSLAIGRQGQNVRLASKLVGYKINVSSNKDTQLSLEEQIRERLLESQAQLAQMQSNSQTAGQKEPAEPQADSDGGPVESEAQAAPTDEGKLPSSEEKGAEAASAMEAENAGDAESDGESAVREEK
ncbi:MAG: transcription termination factor NusA [Deltaproteobacteria bacterium]|nr:transcription termination factor NusA [Deltaproteobacteria bacterium]